MGTESCGKLGSGKAGVTGKAAGKAAGKLGSQESWGRKAGVTESWGQALPLAPTELQS
jgi:hypothetical protein